MAIAHVCMGCGQDLARRRVRIEPHYGLPLVTCPRCGLHCTRRRHPIWVAWRSTQRASASIGALLAQFSIVLLLSGLMFGLVADDQVAWTLANLDRATGDDMAWPFALLGGMGIATGTWLTIGLSHWRRRWTPWLAWTAYLLSCIVIGSIYHWLDLVRMRSRHVDIKSAMRESWWQIEQWLGTSLPLFGAVLVLSIIGIPIGRIILRSARIGRARRWAKRRRKRRLQAAL